MAYGEIEYDADGLPKCEICNLHFHRVAAHVRQKHDMDAITYKKTFGFDVGKGICSKKSAALSRDHNKKNYDKVVKKNLLNKGVDTRFKKGAKGRTRDKVSEQTLRRLKQNVIKLKKND